MPQDERNIEFLLSGNLGQALNRQKEYEPLTKERQEGPRKKPETPTPPSPEQQQEYLTGGGQEAQTAEQLRQERQKQRELIYKVIKEGLSGDKIKIAKTAAALGVSLQKSLGRDKFSQFIIITLAIADDILDNIDLLLLNTSLGMLGSMISIAISVILFIVAIRAGGGITRWLIRVAIVYTLDTLFSTAFLMPFMPVTTISYTILIIMERRKAKKEDRALLQA